MFFVLNPVGFGVTTKNVYMYFYTFSDAVVTRGCSPKVWKVFTCPTDGHECEKYQPCWRPDPSLAERFGLIIFGPKSTTLFLNEDFELEKLSIVLVEMARRHYGYVPELLIGNSRTPWLIFSQIALNRQLQKTRVLKGVIIKRRLYDSLTTDYANKD